MARHVVIGTAGHVDHGKTTLVKALTGIDTDSTKEEKRRGLTINLGFAYLDLPDGTRAGIVDVPGHERFIKNMVAGLPGLGMVLLVVDANEGVMPQTFEHMDILTLLGIKDFLIAVTKADTVDEDMLDLVKEDIRSKLADTAAADADIIETDAFTGRGLSELVAKLQDMTSRLAERSSGGAARLNIDRVFSVKGFGTIVTGTLLDGTVLVGEELFLYPKKLSVRVRNIQVHEQNVEQAEAGQRTALNLANIGINEVHRGNVLCASGELAPTRMIDVKISCLERSNCPIQMWERLRLLIGTQEVMVRAVPLGTEAILPGQEGFAQLRLEREEIVVKAKDRFILRTFSPMRTIGGGEVLDANPRKHRRFKEAVLDSLKAKDSGRLDEGLCDYLLHKTEAFARQDDVMAAMGTELAALNDAAARLSAEGLLYETAAGYIHRDVYKKLKGKAVQFLLAYHKAYPLRPGMSIGEFRARLSDVLSEKEAGEILRLMEADGSCRIEVAAVAASRFRITFTPEQEKARGAMTAALIQSGYTPVKIRDLTASWADGRAVLEAMRGKTAVILSPEYVMARRAYDDAVCLLCRYVKEKGPIELAAFRDLLGIGRKSALQLLEYMDEQHVTRRADGGRVLGDGADCAESR